MNEARTTTRRRTRKVCSRCGRRKALESFARNRRKRDGRHSECRACGRLYYVKRREAAAKEGGGR